ncbi:MAG TPA: DNA-processing protein DprA [Pseudomonadales bacterium]|jgi:DNA processing protein|nr:DNA-processing protein DprA [Pseudomonadales bacterium]HNI36707.1 DNA-processing protein DprA [Pseudomonadales bacterium]HNL91263.1 DNA-processing protein DprA [Pseudomonadales bacterium]HNN86741.1 DNA-processing protein DprA [Pseudomonadales bacterium]
MDDYSETLSWLALNRLPDIGPVSQKKIVDAAGGMQALLCAPERVLQSYLQPEQAALWRMFCEGSVDSLLRQQAQRDLEAATAVGAVILTAESQNYPLLLEQISAAPTVLYVRGDVTALHLPQLAIVGSRNASATGLEIAQEFSAALAQHGLAVTSGLALGIDGAVHRGALQVSGKTIAVVATGVDDIYPRRHAPLFADILANGGAIVSELPPQSPPLAQNFPRRNRIISGLSLGTLVVEASLQSGSLITARYASEQGREVFAMPGSVRSVFHRGCHALIRQGAKLVETTQDILDELGGLLAFKQQEFFVIHAAQPTLGGLSDTAKKIFSVLDYSPVSLDVLAMRCALPADALTAALMDLEMEGVVTQQYGFYSRV